jgi:hypothetical protein
MKYREPRRIDREEFGRIRTSGNSHAIYEALVGLALNESEDWRLVQNICLEHIADRDWTIRAIAATCLGHLARIHGELDLEIVVPELQALMRNSKTSSYASDALEDIEMFISND